MIFCGKTDKGKIRNNNEDSFLADAPLFVVADGMGGHAAGELASKLAVDVFAANKSKIQKTNRVEILKKVAELANKKIIEKSAVKMAFGMGSTLTAVAIKKKKIFGVHAGDSRAYIINDSSIEQLTRDHTFVNELVAAGSILPEDAKVHPNRNIITKALGVEEELGPDTFERKIQKDAILLVASDGLTSILDDRDIHSIVTQNKNDLEKACDLLIQRANELGGKDNITVILVDPLRNPVSERTSIKDIAITAVEIILATGIIFGILIYYLSTQYYVQLVKNDVILFQGHPKKIFNIPFARQIERKKISRKDVPDWYAERLREGVSVNGLKEGRDMLLYVKSYSAIPADAD